MKTRRRPWRNLDKSAKRANPFEAPRILLDTVDGSLPDQLDAVVRRIDELPSKILDLILKDDRYFEAERLQDLRDFVAGLRRLRHDLLPSRDQLGMLACPSEMLRDIADGFQDATEVECLPDDVARIIQSEIVAELSAVADAYLPTPAHTLVEDWVDRIEDRRVVDGPHSKD